MDIDAIIAEAIPATDAAQPQAEIKTEDAKEVETPESEAPETDEAKEPEVKETPQEDAFPKKAVNKISKLERKIGKQHAEKQQLLKELETLKKQASPESKVKDDAPKEDDFDTYGEYLRAEARYAAKQELRESQSTDKQERVKQLDTEIETQQKARRTETAEAARKVHKDFDTVLNKAFENVNLAPHVIEALDEAENGALVLYSLAKENFDLDELNGMSLAKVAMTIARTEDKAVATKTKQVSNAPAPMSPAKGVGTGSKALDRMNYNELKESLGIT